MKLLKMTALLLIAVSLFGCVDTPNSLKESKTEPNESGSIVLTAQSDEMSREAENTSAKTNTTIERGSLEEIRNQLETDLKKSYKNISITRARVSDAETMPVYNIKIGKNSEYNFKTLIEKLYGDSFDCTDDKYYRHRSKGDLIDPDSGEAPHSEPVFDKDKSVVSGINVYTIDIDAFAPYDDNGYYKNGDHTISTYFYSIGNLWGSQSGGGGGKKPEEWYYYESRDIYKSYDLFFEKPSKDEIYTMADGQKWNVNDAIKYVENFWNEYIAPSDPADYTYSVKTIWIMELGEDKYSYLFSMQRQDENGNYFDSDFTDYYFTDRNAVPSGEPFIFTNRLYTYCAQKEVLTRFTKDYSFSCEKATDKGDNLLSLGAASDLLSEKLAPNIGLKLTAEVNYVVMCKGYPYYELWEYPEFYEHTCLTECDFEIRPVWCFKPENQCYLKNYMEVERYYVDAVTGEVSTIVRNIYQKGDKIGQSSGW